MGKYYDATMLALHREVKLACQNINSCPCDKFSKEVSDISTEIRDCNATNWSDSAKISFDELKSEVFKTLRTVEFSISSNFKRAEETYIKLNQQLQELQKADTAYTELLENEPKPSDYQEFLYLYKGEKKYGTSYEYYRKHNEWKEIKTKLEKQCTDMQEMVNEYIRLLKQINGLGISGDINAIIIFLSHAVIPFDNKSYYEFVYGFYSLFPDSTLYTDYMYGGSQSRPYKDYMNGDYYYAEIIRRYYPDITDEEVSDYLNALKSVGCGYTATANYFFQAYEGREEEYERDFGFPMYVKDQDGNMIPTVNYLLTDLYCYSWKNGIVSTKPDDPNAKYYPGGAGCNKGSTYALIEDLISTERYKNVNIGFEVIEDRYGKKANFEDYTKEINNVLQNGGVVRLDATDYTLYPANENNPYGTVSVVDGRHAMTITGVKDGNYIISTWENEFILDSSSVDENFSLSAITFN